MGCLYAFSLRQAEAAALKDTSIGNGVVTVLGSSVDPARLYVTTYQHRLFVGSGTPTHWQERTAPAPLRLVLVRPSHGHDVIYADLPSFFQSANGGTSWQRLSCNLIIDSSGAAISPQQPKVIYLGADAGDGPQGNNQGGFYATRDGGRSWTRELSDEIVRAVAVNPRNVNDATIAPNGGGVARTLDRGGHWTFADMGYKWVGQDGPQVESLAYGPGPSYTLWAAAQQGIFRRSGGTWRPAGLQDRVTAPDQDLSVVPDARSTRLVFAIRWTRSAFAFRTLDSGKTWHRIPELPRGIRGISVRPADDTVYAWTNKWIYRSTDHGDTWTRLPAIPKG